MAKRVVLIKHEESPPDDRAATWLTEQGFELDWRAPYDGDSLGDPEDDVAGTVIYGGGQGVTEMDIYPFLADEARWVERCMARDIPTLGLAWAARSSPTRWARPSGRTPRASTSSATTRSSRPRRAGACSRRN